MSLRIRRGGGSIAPPPTVIYGPTDGAAAIRSGAGARAVSNPGGGVSFNSATSLQSAINAQPANTTFVCSVNNPTWASNVFVGSKNPTIIFPGAVGQCVINGGGNNIIAIDGPAGQPYTVKGGTFQNFGTTGNGIIMVLRNGCVVEDVVATANWNMGISVQGTNNRISHCTLHTNGVEGYAVIIGSQNTTIEYCNVYGNNTRQTNPGNEAGAGKILNSSGDFHHNWVHDNIGFGAWWDTNAWSWVIEENVCEDNYLAGLFFEANYGSVIQHNLIQNNGRNVVIGGFPASFENCVNVRLSDCAADRTDPDGLVTPVAFTRNIVDHTGSFGGLTGGILIIWDHSATSIRHAANHDVYENQFWFRDTTTMRLGGEDTAPGAYPVWTSDNNFFSNEYHVTSMSTNYWKWDTGTGQGVAQSWTSWQGFHSGETINRIQI